MRKLMLNCIVALGLIPMAFSCDDDAEPSSSFTFNGETSPLSKGFARYNESFSEWRILLASNGITYDETIDDFVGTGNGVFFNVYDSKSDNALPEGWYYHAEGEVVCGAVFQDCNLSSQTASCSFSMNHVDVSVNIKKSGGAYEIILSGDGIKLTFKGEVAAY